MTPYTRLLTVLSSTRLQNMNIQELQHELDSFDSGNGPIADADAYFAGMDRHTKIQKMLAIKLGREPGGLVLALKRKDNKYLGAFISPEPNNTSEWRVTWFDERGFSGDTRRKSKALAVYLALSEGYRDIDRNLLRKMSKLKSFQEGNEMTERYRSR